MQGVSRSSAARFRALVTEVSAVANSGRTDGRVALADRLRPTAVHQLDLDTGHLSTGEAAYDVIILDSDAARRLSADDVRMLNTLLRPDGVIAIRLQSPWARTLHRLFRRREHDMHPTPFLRGLPRSGAALLQARLYVRELTVRTGAAKDSWVIGSPAPVGDNRYRDQIGRVATDYLRALGPIIAGAHLPGI